MAAQHNLHPGELELTLSLDESASAGGLDAALAQRLGHTPRSYEILRRSLDARKGRAPLVRYLVRVGTSPTLPPPLPWPRTAEVGANRRVAIVGTGPAGLFAALRLVLAGNRPLLIERGKPVQPRRRDLALLTRGTLAADSNYCFGEGGAGTYSDGKLYTRTKDRAATEAILATLVHFGADPKILFESRPHIGSNRLPRLVAAIREFLEAEGATYVWEDPLVRLRLGKDRAVRGVELRSGRCVDADAVVLAVGHSARDVYAHLAGQSVAMAPKPLAIGVRVEHPQPVIDALQYGAHAAHPQLPAAFYHITSTQNGRGIYSFCMCPGGWIVPSATEPGHLCTNGMSLSRRDSPYANAALVVTVTPADFPADAGVLGGIALQRSIEATAFAAGGGGYLAPAQRVSDFVSERPSTTVGATSYRPGVVAADFREVLPPLLFEPLRQAVAEWGRKMRGFITNEALLVGVETRTSAPVRILRDPATLMSVSHPGLYPSAEGAGYAGGIISAAIDGVRVAERILRSG